MPDCWLYGTYTRAKCFREGITVVKEEFLTTITMPSHLRSIVACAPETRFDRGVTGRF